MEIRAYLGELIEEKRRQPGEDLLSELVAAESEGDKLSETELLNSCITLLVAGHETTTSLIGNGLYTLLPTPINGGSFKMTYRFLLPPSRKCSATKAPSLANRV